MKIQRAIIKYFFKNNLAIFKCIVLSRTHISKEYIKCEIAYSAYLATTYYVNLSFVNLFNIFWWLTWIWRLIALWMLHLNIVLPKFMINLYNTIMMLDRLSLAFLILSGKMLETVKKVFAAPKHILTSC